MSDEKPMADVVPLPVPGSRAERVQALRSLLSAWWEPPEDLIDTLPKAGMQLRYLSHVWVSRAFSEIDPEWTWAPMSYDDAGQPVIERDSQGQPVGMWITLTICGTTIPGYGSVDPGKRDAIKELIGDALRNAGMRRGVAGSLWTKEKPSKKAPRKKEPLPAAVERNLEHLRAQVDPPADEDPDSEKTAAIDLYNRLCQQYGQEIVNGALATHKVSKYTEFTPAKGKVIEASLKARARLVKEEEDRAKQLAKEQADAHRAE
jgi:hypothetical protein